MTYITLSPDRLAGEHICCAISDKKCTDGYAAKKQWLSDQYSNGYRFTRLDERGKIFIEYGPGNNAWLPVVAPDWMAMGCFWVSGKYKQKGHGKALIKSAMDAAEKEGLSGLVAVVGKKKMHFQSDGKWLLGQGFEEVDELDNGFSLLALKSGTGSGAQETHFSDSARRGLDPSTKGITVFYSNRCPYTDFHINMSLKETCAKRGFDPTVVKLNTVEEAQNAPTPATIFSLFIDDRFVTTDLSVCMDSRFDRIIEKAGETNALL